MAQDLTVNIKTTSDVPQAMDRAKGATVSFGKQVEDITKKFSTGFKDIFLSFLGPMALLGTAIAFIGKLIADNQRAHAEANQAAIDETNKLMSAEDTYWARKQAREKKTKEDIEQAKTTREDVTLEFLKTDPRGRQMLFDYAEEQRKKGSNKAGRGYASEDKAMQDKVQALIAEDMAKTGMIAKPGETAAIKATTFQSPAGVNAVVGMGNNAAMQAMLDQLEEQRKQTALLQQIASSGGDLPADFTKPTSAAPSRSAYLRK
jgi:hypothetical protein